VATTYHLTFTCLKREVQPSGEKKRVKSGKAHLEEKTLLAHRHPRTAHPISMFQALSWWKRRLINDHSIDRVAINGRGGRGKPHQQLVISLKTEGEREMYRRPGMRSQARRQKAR